MASNVRIITLPDVFGAEWVEESGTTFQLAYSKGTSRVTFGLRPASGGQWSHMTVDQPERFGPLPAKNMKAWRAWVDSFLGLSDPPT